MDSIEIFGQEVPLKTHHCSLRGEEHQPVVEPYVNLYLRTKHCNARCAFCTYHSDASKWDQDRYVAVLDELRSKIRIKKMAFSGGEPMLYWDNFKRMVATAKEMVPDACFSLNTDGIRWGQFFSDPVWEGFDYIQLSRHHYDDSRNDAIFRTRTPTTDEIRAVTHMQSHPHQIQFRCNLIKGEVDTRDEVFRYLDWANSVGVNDVGLVSLMPINDYSRENFVYFHIRELIGENFILTKTQERHGGGCECFNYVYMPKEEEFRRPMRVYHKNTYEPDGVSETLVFDGRSLRIGFSGKVIY